MKNKMKKEINFSELEKRLLYNFVVGERNRIIYPKTNLFKSDNEIKIEIEFKPCWVNLKNFKGSERC